MLPEKKKHNRNKLDLNKAEHFLDFIFSSGISQDVAYRVTRIKYDNGEEQKISHAVLTAKFSHAITMYKESCNEVGYSPLSDRSLFRILSAIKPSQRKCLDNAGCYHGNFSAESMYKICKEKNLRYDFDEPCCGKDQCDRECAAGKCIIRSFVDSGNYLLTGDDIYTALHYGNRLNDAKVGVAEITDVSLDGKKIQNISNYHSIEFHEEFMTMWRYYGIGEGVKQPYGGINVQPSIKMIKPYHKTDKREGNVKKQESKKREDSRLCTLLFCQEVG